MLYIKLSNSKRNFNYLFTRIILVLFVALFFTLYCFKSAFALNQAYNTPETKKTTDLTKDLYAKYAVVMDASNLRTLAGKNENTPVPMASTTKIMTCVIALENAPKDMICTTSKYAASMPDVQLNAKSGETYSLNDLLHSLMLKSHNDSAVIIAENVAYNYLYNAHLGNTSLPIEINIDDYTFVPYNQLDTSFIATLEKEQSKLLVSLFTKIMNYKACELGCTNTNFITPNGLDATDETGTHQTTARELAIIMSYCIKNNDFLKITTTKSYSFDRFSFSNTNAFLNMYENIISGKTGFTGDAGYCYVCAYSCEGRTFIVSLLACGWPNNKNYKWHDARLLLNYAREHYFNKTILDDSYSLPDIPVTNGLLTTLKLTYNKQVSLLLSDNEEVSIKTNLPSDVNAPIKKGNTIGSIELYIDNVIYETIPVYATEDIRSKNLSYYLNKLINIFLFIDKYNQK